MKTIHKITLTLITLACMHIAHASAEKKMVGESLPTPKVEFLNGEPEMSGKPMIVEFWATWCPPCRTSIPHLNELYNKYKDRGLVVIGISKEDPSVVKAFLVKTPMAYYPAIDAGGAYSKQFKIKGIPHAMLVDKTGKVVWEGHPMSLKESSIAKVL